jgi:hypothetical protein
VPDLSEGGEWHRARLAKLNESIQDREDWNQLWEEGLEALKIHRENYTPAGPRYLQTSALVGVPANAPRGCAGVGIQHALPSGPWKGTGSYNPPLTQNKQMWSACSWKH